MESGKLISYKYTFIFEDGNEKEFVINLNTDTLDLIYDHELEKPDWTKKNNFKCPVTCSENKYEPYCPIGIHINHMIKQFSNLPSFQKVKISVEANNRTYSKETSLQVGLGSLFGIIMPASGCPVLGKLKPLVKFHLPFSNNEETEFRVFSMYLLAQFFLRKKGEDVDWEMYNLKKLYEDIRNINRNLAQKIADLEKLDAGINSLIVLDTFADSVSFSLEENLSDLEKLFESWFEK